VSASAPAPRILIVSLGSTAGLRAADAQLAESLRRAGAIVTVASAVPQPDVRTLALTDLRWALAARRAARTALASMGGPCAVLYSSTTAALLAPRTGAIRFDAAAAGNRPGRHGLWQRPAERRAVARAPLLVPWSAPALAEAGFQGRPAVVVPVAVAPSGSPVERDLAAVSYIANPAKKGLDRVLAAWRAARRPGEELVLAGARPAVSEPGVRVAGLLAPSEYRALLRRARVFVCAPRREDYGLAQLEALADGCVLVTSAAPGPYAALELARRLDPRLVGEDLAGALRTVLDDPPLGYAERARELLVPFSPGGVDRVVAEELLPALAGLS
jgi:Glycosyl transferases group 1